MVNNIYVNFDCGYKVNGKNDAEINREVSWWLSATGFKWEGVGWKKMYYKLDETQELLESLKEKLSEEYEIDVEFYLYEVRFL